MSPDAFQFREEVRPDDRETVRSILESSGFFYPEEIAVAAELVEEGIAKGAASGYQFIFAEAGQEVAGYACFGPIACTKASYDLYWIAVRQEHRHRGLGRRLLTACEERIRQKGGKRIYVETSSRQQYAPTRAFYLDRGYRVDAVLEEFYGPGDAKVILVKAL